MTKPREHNPVRVAALICVAVTSLFLMFMNNKVVNILASPDWCGKALQAEKISSQNFGGLTACTELLMVQLKSLATVNQIQSGTIALCLLVLIVIVIAGGKLNLSANKEGITANMSKEPDPIGEAANEVAGAAVDKANEIANDSPVPPPPVPDQP